MEISVLDYRLQTMNYYLWVIICKSFKSKSLEEFRDDLRRKVFVENFLKITKFLECKVFENTSVPSRSTSLAYLRIQNIMILAV